MKIKRIAQTIETDKEKLSITLDHMNYEWKQYQQTGDSSFLQTMTMLAGSLEEGLIEFQKSEGNLTKRVRYIMMDEREAAFGGVGLENMVNTDEGLWMTEEDFEKLKNYLESKGESIYERI